MPTQKLSLELPLFNLSWQEYQKFCLDYVSNLPGVKHAFELGREGDPQEGIDIVALMDDDRKITYQCRRVHKFQPADVTKLMRETTYEADEHYILTACDVPSNTHNACKEGWAIITGPNLSSKIRALPAQRARRLVLTYFGINEVSNFLGFEEFPPFLSAEEFYKQWLQDGKLISHNFVLVGRKTELQTLLDFVESNDPLMILSGFGGVGKSKLILEACRAQGQKKDLLLLANRLITKVDLLELPKDAVIIIDDAHKNQNFTTAVELQFNGREDIKIIAVIRPYALEAMKTQLTSLGYEPSRIPKVELKALTRDESLELAREVLGTDTGAERLSELTRKSPLSTVLMGLLIKKKGIDFGIALNDDDIRSHLLSRFDAEVRATILDNELQVPGKKLIRLIASLGPLPCYHQEILPRILQFLSITEPELTKIISAYEREGILSSRKGLFDVQPDLLSDYLIEDSCYAGERETGYATTLFDTFSDVLLPELLLNVSELDWRRMQNHQSATLFSSLFNHSMSEIVQSRHLTELLTRMENIAYYQPANILSFAKSAKGGIASNESLNALAKMLMPAGYNGDHTEEVMIFLWNLYCDGVQQAQKQLSELISFRGNKPIWFAQLIYHIVTKRLQSESREAAFPLIEALLEILLAKTALHAYYDAGKFFYQGVKMPYEPLKDGRKAILSELIKWLGDPDAQRRRTAIKGLKKALTDPFPDIATTVTDEDRVIWADEQLFILEALEAHVQVEESMSILQEISHAVSWHANHNRSEAVKNIAQRITTSLMENLTLSFFKVLINDHSLIQLADTTQVEISSGIPFTKYERGVEFLHDNYSEPKGAYDFLKQMAEEAKHVERAYGSYIFLSYLGNQNPEFTLSILELASNEGNGDILSQSSGALRCIRNKIPSNGFRSFAESNNEQVRAMYAASFSGLDWSKIEHDATFEELSTSLNDAPNVAASAARAMLMVPEPFKPRALERLSDLFSSKEQVVLKAAADTVCYMLHEFRPSGYAAKRIIEQLEYPDSLEDYEFSHIINKLLPSYTDEIIEVLLRRIRNAHTSMGFYGMPHHELIDFKIIANDIDHWKSILRKVRDESISYKSHDLSQFFVHVGLQLHDDTSVEVLEELITDDKDSLIRAAFLVSTAPPVFLFEHSGFICKLVEAAANIDSETYETVKSYLFGTFFHGHYLRSHGVPSERDVMARDKSAEILQTLPPNSSSHSFYAAVHAIALSEIERDMKRDFEEMNA